MSAEERQERIDAYLNGELQGEELKAFEEAVQNDEALRNEVRLFKDIDLAVQDKAAIAFQKMVQEEGEAFLQQEDQPQAKIRKMGARQWAVAATILLLLISGAFWWSKSSATVISGPEMYAQNYTTYSLNVEMRGGDTNGSSFEEGIISYQAGNFSQASQLFALLVVANPEDMVLTFCLANAYLNETPPRVEEAQQLFEQIIRDGESIYVPRSEWYLGLILLKQEDLENAKKHLTRVAVSGDNYAVQAQEILTKMEE